MTDRSNWLKPLPEKEQRNEQQARELKELLLEQSSQLREVTKQLAVMRDRMTTIERSTTNMDNHISFVERVYEHVKWPFHRLMTLVGRTAPPLTAGEDTDQFLTLCDDEIR